MRNDEINENPGDVLGILTDSLSLHEVLLEMGKEVMADGDLLEKMIRQFNNIDTSDVLCTLLFFLRENLTKGQNKPTSNLKKISESVIILDLWTHSAERPTVEIWDIENLVKTINKVFFTKVSWLKILQAVDSDSPLILDLLSDSNVFREFWKLVASLINWFNLKVPYSLFNRSWRFYNAQKIFLTSCFQMLRVSDDLCVPPDFLPSNKMAPADLTKTFSLKPVAGNFSNAIRDLGPLWVDPAVLTLLVEVSEDRKYFTIVSNLLEEALKKDSEGVLLVLFHCRPREGLKLFREILESSLKLILNNGANFSELIEAFFKIDKDLLALTLAQICEKENSFLFLSKILDMSQNIRESLLSLIKSENHFFSIKLALMAVKREYLRLEYWVNDRLTACGLEWVEAFLRYVHWHLVVPLSENNQHAFVEEALERSQLTMNAIAIIFENFLLNNVHEGVVGTRYVSAIKKLYSKIQKIIPQLSQVSINDTDKKANKLLEDLYYRKIDIDQFVDKLERLKKSKSNRDQEILSCIIINIVDEFRFYKNFPRQELLLTAQVFGRVIKHRIIDGKTSTIIVKAVIDSLGRDDNMFDFGRIALEIFLDDVELLPGFAAALAANSTLFDRHFELLERLLSRLEREHCTNFLPPDVLKRLTVKRAKRERDKAQAQQAEENKKQARARRQQGSLRVGLRKNSSEFVISSNTKILEPPSRGQDQKIEREQRAKYGAYKTVIEYVDKKYYKKEATFAVPKGSKDKLVIFTKKLVQPVETRIPEFQALVTDGGPLEDWFVEYFVFKKAMVEASLQDLYLNFLLKLGRKNMLKKVYFLSMEAVDDIMKFGRYVDIKDSKDTQFLRNVARWLGLITFFRNRPILRSKLDFRKRVVEAVQTPTINAFLPMLTILINLGKESALFKPHNPYIQGLLDLCRELQYVSSINSSSKEFIKMIFKKFQIKEDSFFHFNYIARHSELRSVKSKMPPRIIQSLIKIDATALTPIFMDRINDIKSMVASAIVSSVETVTKPILERSVKNAIHTTGVLCKKDFACEPDDERFLAAAKAMVSNLAGNLALVTCREPLRSQITLKLNAMLADFAGGDERLIEKVRRSVLENNLNLACSLVHRRVIYNAMEQITKDNSIKHGLDARRAAKMKGLMFLDQEELDLCKDLPEDLRPARLPKHALGELYSSKAEHIGLDNYIQVTKNKVLLMEERRYVPGGDGNGGDEDMLMELLSSLEKEMAKPQSSEKINKSNKLFYRLNMTLKNFRNDVSGPTKRLVQRVFNRIRHPAFDLDKGKSYFDVIAMCHRFNPQIAGLLVDFLANLSEKKKNKSHIAHYAFRKNMVSLHKFDAAFANKLRTEGVAHVNVVVQILKRLVIEDKIFDIQAFPKLTEQLLALDDAAFEAGRIKRGSAIFIKNLKEYMRERSDSSRTKFSLSNLEPEYAKLEFDLDEYFNKSKRAELLEMEEKYAAWLKCRSSTEKTRFVRDFAASLSGLDTNNHLTKFFSYLFEKIISESLAHGSRPSLAKIDSFSSMIIRVLEEYENMIEFLERVLTSLIMVITRNHFFVDDGLAFNQKPVFRLLFNLVLEIHRRDSFSEDKKAAVSIIVIHTLRILQPVKYPGFCFAWLALVSNRFIMRSLLTNKKNDYWSNYTMLLNGLMLFFKEAQAKNQLSSAPVSKFYKATVFFLLVLSHDFPEYVADQTEFILEELPSSFKQVRNIILAAFPQKHKIVPPKKAISNLSLIEQESPKLPPIPAKIENRVCSMGLHLRLAKLISKPTVADTEHVRDLFYLFDYLGKRSVNKKLVCSFVLYTCHFVYAKASHGGAFNDKKIKGLKKNTFQMFHWLLEKEEWSLRETLINAFADNLRRCDQYTVYFAQLLCALLVDLKNPPLEQLIFKILFERMLVGDNRPWGLIMTLHYLFHTMEYLLPNKEYYKKNKHLFHRVFELTTQRKSH